MSGKVRKSASHYIGGKKQIYPIIVDKNDTNISFNWNNTKTIYKKYGTDLNTIYIKNVVNISIRNNIIDTIKLYLNLIMLLVI